MSSSGWAAVCSEESAVETAETVFASFACRRKVAPLLTVVRPWASAGRAELSPDSVRTPLLAARVSGPVKVLLPDSVAEPAPVLAKPAEPFASRFAEISRLPVVFPAA